MVTLFPLQGVGGKSWVGNGRERGRKLLFGHWKMWRAGVGTLWVSKS